MADIDYSKPVSTLLKEGTMEAHKDVEHSDAAAQLLSGKLEKGEYIRYLMVLYEIYDELERALEQHATHLVLEPIHNPTLLARAPAISSDIARLLDAPAWKAHPSYLSLRATPPPAVRAYKTRLRELAQSEDPSPLLAHAYVRYLGDLSGGQQIRHTIAKAYGLDENTPESGLAFYDFKELQSSKKAGLGEMRRIKDWFREGMNRGVGDDAKRKEAIVTEANIAFKLNGGIFDSILLEDVNPENVVSPTEKQFPMSSFLSVIIAVGLAHFILVVGGFTGARGKAKWFGFEEWLDSVFKNYSSSA
ncbi:uncharacterized protein SCHCODRAFT_02616941 [Schizophyllum commune H4-8]|uniref:Uncharacterized protein n=1 Tax=Schizophyllum commune (strain H4-8 / FGSC 9210) TaxID=578458 RepID=D8PY86_SCHCM|nr:uncharacterized protein SCHCODRAFT_02616941 [Schizophyllum commune H4-8]KAI5897225.1 hypothetical protein SCHCODRAFT_02616941 [Schizophyllum commune H4-8]